MKELSIEELEEVVGGRRRHHSVWDRVSGDVKDFIHGFDDGFNH